ncbi:MAG: 3-phosphoglycerate dehydrogenase [Alphaproteobacteria bacterium]|nr:3-phosphoglycerate dehydrogenase [Alphaproteobacteria bacterium]MCB9791847.1 3-phosphoglycerate dehydrogenase [Alphaproteobacteria bacterium]
MLQKGGIEVVRVDRSPDEAELMALLEEHQPHVLFKRSRVPVTRQVLESNDSLVAIQLCSIGDDSIDKAAAAERGILVFNDPVSNGRSVVELVIGAAIALSRRLFESYTAGAEGVWEKSNQSRYEIAGKTLGIVGLGNIGRAVARAAEAMGMDILFHDSRDVAMEVGQEMGWTAAPSMEAVFRGADIVTLHLSATDVHGRSNAGCITGEMIQSLGAERPENSPRIFINFSRGFLHSAEDLIAAVDAGRVRRASVDVYPEEPRANGPGWVNPYANHPLIATTPHVGAATQEAQPRIARRVAQTQLAFSHHGAIRECVYSPRTRITMADDHREGRAVLVVLHSTARGTKKALDDAIYEAEADNLRSQHRDFLRWGLAVDVNLLDRPLSTQQLQAIAEHTTRITGDPQALRLVRQIAAR